MKKLRSVFVYGSMVVGILLTALLVGGVVADRLSFDRTSGGNVPPYTDFTGEPIDWKVAHVTDEGFFKDGYVVDTYVNCTTGMVSLEVYGQRWDWRELSGRALVVHEPAEASRRTGFELGF